MSEEYFFLVVIPVINGLVEVAKRAGLANRYAPLLAVGLGLVAGLGLNAPGANPALGIINGLVLGLSAVGMYSGTRNVLRSNGKNPEA